MSQPSIQRDAGPATADGRAQADPRPVVETTGDGPLLVGGRCLACAHPVATAAPRCPRCGGETQVARHGPDGTVYAATEVFVASAGRPAPYTIAYLDLDDGPRLLVHLDGAGAAGAPALVGGRARLTGLTASGDPAAEVYS